MVYIVMAYLVMAYLVMVADKGKPPDALGVWVPRLRAERRTFVHDGRALPRGDSGETFCWDAINPTKIESRGWLRFSPADLERPWFEY